MDINEVRALVTLASFVAFLGVVWWAYSARRKDAFDRAAQSIMKEADEVNRATGARGGRQ